jgi:hypothetical protein
MPKILVILFAVLALAFCLPAQAPDSRLLQSVQQVVAERCVPLHTRTVAAGQPEYGWWAGGPTWKASFHDGLTFHPFRGADRELVALRWRTASITVGGQPLSLAPVATETSEDRYETRYRDAREVYEIRPEGVEQLFVIPQRPAGSGELVVTGRIAGDLTTPDRAAEHGDLVFSVDGEATVRYGRAFAFDAAGQRIEIATSAERGLVRLHVPQSFVDAAQFPLTIDPLIGNALINSNFAGEPATSVELACSTVLDQVVVTFVRTFALGDADGFSLYGKKDFTGFNYHWIDNAPGYFIKQVDVTYCEGARSYVIAFDRDVLFFSLPVVYVQRDDQMQNDAGTEVQLATGSSGVSWGGGVVGGGFGTCTKALTAWAWSSGLGPQVTCAVIDAANPTAGVQFFDPHGSAVTDASRDPDVMPMSRDGEPWRVAWRTDLGATQEIRVATVTQAGTSAGYVGYDDTSDELGAPRIAGAYDDNHALRQVLVWQREAPLNDVLRGFDFGSGSQVRTLTAGPQLQLREVVADHATGSNFLLAYSVLTGLTPEIYLARLGGHGAIVDSEVLGSYGSLGMCFEPTGEPDFLLAYDNASALRQIRGTRFVYPTDAESVSYGTSCATAFLEAPYPFAGNLNFAVTVTFVPQNTPMLLALGTTPANVSLQPFGFPCSLLVTPVITYAAIGTGGDLLFPVPLPDDPAFLGDLYAQAFRPFDDQASDGLRIQVR